MKYASTLERLLKLTPSIETRIAQPSSVYAILATPDNEKECFGRNPDAVFYYDGALYNEDSEVIDFAHLKSICNDDGLFVISNLQARDIVKNLREQGFDNVLDVTHYGWRNARILDTELMAEHFDEIRKVFARLDKESADILLGVLLFRILLDPKVLNFSTFPQYFHPMFPTPGNDTIIDGGAFIGDSAFDFFNASQGKAEIFSFEPDVKNFNVLFKNIRNNKVENSIHAFPFGLWNSVTSLSFDNANQSSRILDNGGSQILTVDLDSFCAFHEIEPTLIKLDVEGAEVEAIQGARGVIERSKPKMCVSLYHLAEHIWELPLLLQELRDDYVLHIGHHSPNLTIYETVLYAH